MQNAINSGGPDGSGEHGIMEGSMPPADGGMLACLIACEEVIGALHALKDYKSSGADIHRWLPDRAPGACITV